MSAVRSPQDIEFGKFSEWLDCNDNFPTPYSDKTKRVYRSVVSGLLHFLHKEDIRSFEEFNSAWLRRFISRNPETSKPYSLSYQILRTSALNVLWFWLGETGVTTSNPVALLIKEKQNDTREPSGKPLGGKRAKRLPEILGWDEQRMLLTAVQDSVNRTCIRDYALISLVLASGLRCEEICTLLCPNIDLDYSRLRTIGKGNKERIVDFSHDTQAVGAVRMWLTERESLLRCLGKSADVLFVSINGNAMTGSLVYQQIAKYLKSAGLNGRTRHKGAHLLRHTATSIMFARKVAVPQIQANLGHGQLITTQIYAHLLPSEISRQSAVF